MDKEQSQLWTICAEERVDDGERTVRVTRGDGNDLLALESSSNELRLPVDLESVLSSGDDVLSSSSVTELTVFC